jgi:hypothetical protein
MLVLVPSRFRVQLFAAAAAAVASTVPVLHSQPCSNAVPAVAAKALSLLHLALELKLLPPRLLLLLLLPLLLLQTQE